VKELLQAKASEPLDKESDIRIHISGSSICSSWHIDMSFSSVVVHGHGIGGGAYIYHATHSDCMRLISDISKHSKTIFNDFKTS